ncbi:MAG TPA: sigma-70 family RNA polymerase sigma factor [Planctomycetota bacterium]|nr:sigma-70 family RNA polymerase sigma factor [Planctomycetota bacterium]
MDASEEFVRLMTAHQGRLFAYLVSLLGDPDAANDVLQETNIVLWRDHKEYRPGSNFTAWAFRVAHFQVMACRQRRLRDRLVYPDDLLETLAPAAKAVDELYEDRRSRLAGCLQKIAGPHRELLRRRYADGESLQSIADWKGTTANAVTQTLFRIRQALLQCVGKTT